MQTQDYKIRPKNSKYKFDGVITCFFGDVSYIFYIENVRITFSYVCFFMFRTQGTPIASVSTYNKIWLF